MIMNCDAFILPKKVAEISQRVYCKKYTYYIINMSCTLRTVEGTPLESTFPGKYQVQKTGAADALAGSQQATTPGNGAAGAPISPPCCSSSKASFLPLLLPPLASPSPSPLLIRSHWAARALCFTQPTQWARPFLVSLVACQPCCVSFNLSQ